MGTGIKNPIFRFVLSRLLVVVLCTATIACSVFGASFAMAQTQKAAELALSSEVANQITSCDFDAAKETLDRMTPTAKTLAYRSFCDNWAVNGDTSAFDSTATLYKALDKGNFYKLSDCFVYIPSKVDASTRYLVHFAGGVSGWMLRQDYAQNYLAEYEPNGIMIFYKESWVPHVHDGAAADRTAELMGALTAKTGVAPQDIAISGSSNGGYSTLYLAVDLFTKYHIVTKRIMILDMGLCWGKPGCLITEEEALPMKQMDTVVYHFGRDGEATTMPGAVQFASYGIKFVDVWCKGEGHDQITKDAFRTGAFSCLIGPMSKLDKDWYTMHPVNF